MAGGGSMRYAPLMVPRQWLVFDASSAEYYCSFRPRRFGIPPWGLDPLAWQTGTPPPRSATTPSTVCRTIPMRFSLGDFALLAVQPPAKWDPPGRCLTSQPNHLRPFWPFWAGFGGQKINVSKISRTKGNVHHSVHRFFFW